MDAIEWLIDNGLAANQGDVAVKAGLGPNLISRIKNGHVKAAVMLFALRNLKMYLVKVMRMMEAQSIDNPSFISLVKIIIC